MIQFNESLEHPRAFVVLGRKTQNGREAFTWKFKLTIIGLVLILAAPAMAATYYVAKTGNDSNAGTQAAPWLFEKIGNFEQARAMYRRAKQDCSDDWVADIVTVDLVAKTRCH